MHTDEEVRKQLIDVSIRGKAREMLLAYADLLEKRPSLMKVLSLADEYTNAIDCEGQDIGGCRSSTEILRELGPAVEAALEVERAAEKARNRK